MDAVRERSIERSLDNDASAAMVTLEDVCKDYRRGNVTVPVLRGVTLRVEAGECCVIMGPSGSGKSTLLNLLAGLDTATSGAMCLGGRSVRHLSDADWTRYRREWIGMVFQAFHLVPGLTAADNVGLPLRLRRMSAAHIRTRVGEALEQVGMTNRAAHRPWELSGGEQQRVALARALVHRPRLLLADEPTGNLDAHTAQEIIELIRRAARADARTVLLVTHSDAAARVADRVYELRDGRLHLRPSRLAVRPATATTDADDGATAAAAVTAADDATAAVTAAGGHEPL